MLATLRGADKQKGYIFKKRYQTLLYSDVAYDENSLQFDVGTEILFPFPFLPPTLSFVLM